MSDQLDELFSSIDSLSSLRAKFITLKQPETNYIEFKEKEDTRVPDLSITDKRHFSKALSAFSNADGGLFIWGVRTKRKDGRDIASSLRPITRVEEMAERLRDSLLDSLMPQNPQVRIEAIRNRLGNGGVKCLIPASRNPPHRAMRDREYWTRLDGRSAKLEHYHIRDLMLRHAYPDLQLSIVSRPYDDDTNDTVRLDFRILNVGRAVAKYAGWFVKLQNAAIVTAIGCKNITAENSDRPTASWDIGSTTVLHPNGIFTGAGSLILRFLDGNPISMRAKWYCEGGETKDSSFTFNYPVSDQPAWHLPPVADPRN